MDTGHGIRGCVAALNDSLDSFELLSVSVPDNRNMVLFPEKIGGLYVRLERPFPVYGRGDIDRFDLWLSQSPDLRFWGEHALVLGVEDVPYADDRNYFDVEKYLSTRLKTKPDDIYEVFEVDASDASATA